MKETKVNEEGTIKLRVLLLEDDPNDADLIQAYLEKAGYQLECMVVSQRFEFIRGLFNMVPHIIIADFSLGAYSGLEALTFVRRVFPEIPFIATTGNEDPSIAKQFMAEGATLFLSKNKLEDLPRYFVEAFDLHPNSQEHLLNMRIQCQIRENIEALGEIQAMLGHDGGGSLSRSLREEIEQSISYLLQLSDGLREEAKLDS